MVKSLIKAFLSLIICISLAMPIQAFNFNAEAFLGTIKTEIYNNKYGLALAGVIGLVAYIAYKKQVQKHAKEKKILSRNVQSIQKEKKALSREVRALTAEREVLTAEVNSVCNTLDGLVGQTSI
jgi:hypothetical protein